MKSTQSLVIRVHVAAVTLALLGSTLGAEPLKALPLAKDLPGTLLFHGHYKHRSRGNDISQPSELWVSRASDGSVVALADLPFMGCTEMVSGDKNNQLKKCQVRRAAAGDRPGYGIDLEFEGGKALLTRRGVREDCDGKELAVPTGACFDPNSRPDSYCAANVLLHQFAPKKEGDAKEFRVCDWDNSGEALADYSVKMELKGKEKIEVPAGTFEASHYVLTQTSSANTWFKKRAGHTTDFWALDNGVIVRILRHREPYELVLLDYDVPARLPGIQ